MLSSHLCIRNAPEDVLLDDLLFSNRNRRLAKDFEATIASAEAWLMIASVKLLARRLARA